MMTFEELGISPEICKAVSELGFEQPMPVQEAVIPLLLSEEQGGKDYIALAQTGTGKTAAFGLPLLDKIDPKDRTTQAVVLSPTRELCLQIADDLRDFSKYQKGVGVVAVYGGTSISDQIRSLRHGAQIIVATPGRLIDLIERGKAHLDQVSHIVLDEADEMLNMGFSESINKIFETLPDERQVLLFSATMSKEVERIAKNYLREYKEVVVGSRNEGAEHVNHIYYMVNAKDKYLALKRIVDFYPRIYGIIFCRTKVETQEVADKLIKDGYNAESLHGDLSQQQRDLTMQKFRQHLTQLLVATDVAARGLDVDDLTHVINYSMPDDTESYTHRSGRTGRAGKKGTSIAIINLRERHKIRQVEKTIGKDFVCGKLPTPQEICTKQLFRAIDEIEKTDVDDEQIEPFMKEVRRHFEFVDKEEILKKLVSREFGRFLNYYANAPEIETVEPKTKKNKKGAKSDEGGEWTDWSKKKPREGVQKGYVKLFINLGRQDRFFPGEVMQFINRCMPGRQTVGHIDIMPQFSLVEVPQRDARKVAAALSGAYYHNKHVNCHVDRDGNTAKGKDNSRKTKDNSRKTEKKTARKQQRNERKAIFNIANIEEGSARRKPKKK
ncbi:MAG: DEAD/DEAH box helicase [Prevotella sp.]|nr:DEAD/DEAH box helicase [Prevotella sp.]MBR6190755.1 DEAD/DEAH box helicase [Prevotella sp.]